MMTRTLTATLPSDAIYVSGTVNGVATTWTNTEGQTWETVAERSDRDVYVVALTIINALGTVSETAFTLYYGLHLITDRTLVDIFYVKTLASKIANGTTTEEEIAEWNNGSLKGSYNCTDLNRVGAAILYVADRLNAFGYSVHVKAKTDWLESEWMTPETVFEYLSAFSTLKSCFELMKTTPSVPSDMSGFTYTEANNIEKILEDIDMLLTNASKVWYFSNELFSGEV